MRVAAIYDIHGNVHALRAVLDEIASGSVDLILVGGDVAWGPFPKETVSLLRSLKDAAFIRGNADRETVQASAADGLDQVASVTRWAAAQLTGDDLAWLGNLEETLALDIDAVGEVLFCHGSPRSDEESITQLSPSERLTDALAGVNQPIVVCGHTHIQFEIEAGPHRIVNAGSVGLPYDGKASAAWALLGPRIELRRTEYDVDEAITEMRSSGCPHVEELFVDNLLRPPDPEETATHFESLEAQRRTDP